MNEVVSRFERAAADGPTTVDRIRADAFDEVLASRLTGPAVGVPLPFDGVSLAAHPVTTDPTPRQLREARVGVTPVGPGIAEFGTVVVRSGSEGAEQVSLYPDEHVAVLAASDVVGTLAEAVAELQAAVESGLRSAVLATGPSGTADMGSVVYGAHGPGSVHVVLLEDR